MSSSEQREDRATTRAQAVVRLISGSAAPDPVILRPCVTCAHHISRSYIGDLCYPVATIDPVSGRMTKKSHPAANPYSVWPQCGLERSKGGSCGPSGLLWTPKVTMWKRLRALIAKASGGSSNTGKAK